MRRKGKPLPVGETPKDRGSQQHASHVYGLSHLSQRARVTHQIPLPGVEHSSDLTGTEI